MSIKSYFGFTWPLVIAAIGGIVTGWYRRDVLSKRLYDPNRSIIGFLLGLLRITFSRINFNRTIAFFDIFVIILAAQGAYFLSTKQQRVKWAIVGGILIMSGIYIKHINSFSYPLLSLSEFSSILNLSKITPRNAIIMNTHKNYTPRIMGRSERSYINPGMAQLDKWTHEERNHRWASDGGEKCRLLQDLKTYYSRPIYLRIADWQNENLSNQTCLQVIDQGQDYVIYQLK